MKTVLFSAYFGNLKRPERLIFLERLQAELGNSTRLIAFNSGGSVNSKLKVVNATRGLQSPLPNPMKTLSDWLKNKFPNSAGLLLSHVVGEARKGGGSVQDYSRICQLVREFDLILTGDKPDFVFLWNQFNSFHRIAIEMLKLHNVKYGFFHDGVLPGSVVFDLDGEMGESWVSRSPEMLDSVVVSETEIARAGQYLNDSIGETFLRHPQLEHVSLSQALSTKKLGRRPLIFFAGQNDWHAGTKPDSPERKFHSPIFADSSEALLVLDQVAGEIGAAVVFKPHPLSREHRKIFLKSASLANTLILSSTSINSCIEQASVVTTIASQTSYVALMCGKPVLMLGRNQLTGKKLTYDLQSREELATTIKIAIADPLKSSRKRNLAIHAAKLERAYLFNFGTLGNSFLRRGNPEIAKFIKHCIDLSASEVIKLAVSGKM